MAFVTVLAIIIISVILILFYLKKTYSYWKIKNVISLPLLPFIGSYLDLLLGKKHLAIYAQEIYQRYSKDEKFVGAFKGTLPELIVMDPEIIQHILVKDFNHFQNRGTQANEKDILAQHLFNISGEKWRMLRNKLTTTFTSAKMRQMYPLILECSDQLQRYLKMALEESEVQEMREIMAKYTTDTIGSCVFGMKMSAIESNNSPFREMGKKTFIPSKKRMCVRLLFAIIPKIAKLINLKERSVELETFFVEFVKKIISARQENKSNRHDFMDLMIDLSKEGYLGDDKFQITEELITAQAFVFFVAGFETSSTTMSHALRELALNPLVQIKLVEEIEATLEKNDGKVTYEAVQEMHYLDMVINETLRKYPPVGVLVRKCNSEYKMPNTNLVLDKGILIQVPIYALQHDAKYYPDPEKFQPERFAKDAAKTFHPFAYLPFGEGPRNCIGLRFGKLQTATGLISILSQYRVEPCSKTPMQIKFETDNTTMTSVDGIWLKVKLRN